MNEHDWLLFEQWLDTSWHPGLDAAQIGVYAAELRELEYSAVMAAARAVSLLHDQPGKWRPKPMEIVAYLSTDPSVPTFAEAYRLLFDPQRGALIGSPDVRAERMADLPAVVREFARRQGGDRLRMLPLDDSSESRGKTVGEWARRELEEAWNRHLEATGGREVAALTSGAGVRQLDPLAVLGIERPVELGAGEAA